MLIDTHCHIHDSDYLLGADEVIERAHEAGVMEMICIGSNKVDSVQAVWTAQANRGFPEALQRPAVKSAAAFTDTVIWSL
jgi:Tat protein secretion system quality control protein TatD with DNase activity